MADTLVATNTLVDVRDLKMHFPLTRGIVLQRVVGYVRAVDGVSFSIERGQTLGLVGESGSGKTSIGRTMVRLYKPTGGQILFEDQDLAKLEGEQMRQMRRRVQMVFQDPFASLNPRFTIGSLIAEPMHIYGVASKDEIRERTLELLRVVGLRTEYIDRYPHEFSGGQRQRLAIARAFSTNARLVVLDEPVSALDVSIRAHIIGLLEALQARLGVSYLFIAHDLAAVAHLSHQIAVMYLGKIVEVADSLELCGKPLHPYTKALFAASLPSHPDEPREEVVLSGEVPSALNPPSGCHFHPRCPFAMPQCVVTEPELVEVSRGHQVACHLYEPS